MKSVILALASTASATYLATTTRYYDGQEGACGCGSSSGIYSWQLGVSTGVYTAAGSQALYDTNDATWCGGGCGKCYNLTATGESACSSCGSGETAGTTITVMVTNLCPYSGNEQWCPSVNETNEYGYYYHFDIMAESEVFGDNPVVEFVPVTCPTAATTDFEQCECYGELETDETPAGLISSDSSSSSSSSSSAAAVAASSSSATSVATIASTSATAAAETTSSVATTMATSIVSSVAVTAESSKTSTAAATSAAVVTASTAATTASIAATTSIVDTTTAAAVVTTSAATVSTSVVAATASVAASIASSSALTTSYAKTSTSPATTTAVLAATTDDSCAVEYTTTTVFV